MPTPKNEACAADQSGAQAQAAKPSPEPNIPEVPPDAPDFQFRSGEDGIRLHEVTLRFVVGEGTEIKGIKFRPREGITALDMSTDMRRAVVESVTLTVGADAHFPGVVFQAGADLLLCLQDREWRDKVVAEVRTAHAEEQARIAAEEQARLTAEEQANPDMPGPTANS
jgi:hypothetical protein